MKSKLSWNILKRELDSEVASDIREYFKYLIKERKCKIELSLCKSTFYDHQVIIDNKFVVLYSDKSQEELDMELECLQKNDTLFLQNVYAYQL